MSKEYKETEKSIGRRDVLKILGWGAAVLTGCADLKVNTRGSEKPVKIDYSITGELHYHIFDKAGEKTGLYVTENLYKSLSRDKTEKELLKIEKIPGLENHYILTGEGTLRGAFNNLSSGEGFMEVYYNRKPVKGIYVSAPKVANSCSVMVDPMNPKEQIYDGRFEKIPGTSLELKCARFDDIDPVFLGGGGDGSGGASGGGGQGSGGGDSGGSR